MNELIKVFVISSNIVHLFFLNVILSTYMYTYIHILLQYIYNLRIHSLILGVEYSISPLFTANSFSLFDSPAIVNTKHYRSSYQRHREVALENKTWRIKVCAGIWHLISLYRPLQASRGHCIFWLVNCTNQKNSPSKSYWMAYIVYLTILFVSCTAGSLQFSTSPPTGETCNLL